MLASGKLNSTRKDGTPLDGYQARKLCHKMYCANDGATARKADMMTIFRKRSHFILNQVITTTEVLGEQSQLKYFANRLTGC